MIEALACGTPVIARPCGSVPEILRHGVTGFVASSVDELVAAVGRVGELSRQTCRREFETRFTAEVMAANYERLYCQLADTDWKLRRTAARSRSYIGDIALARYAARRWHPSVRGNRAHLRLKDARPLAEYSAGGTRTIPVSGKKFDS